jgi:hypothetical protein
MCVTVTVGAAEKISLWFETCESVFVQYLRNIIDRSLGLWVPFLLVVRLVLLYFNIWEREREREQALKCCRRLTVMPPADSKCRARMNTRPLPRGIESCLPFLSPILARIKCIYVCVIACL